MATTVSDIREHCFKLYDSYPLTTHKATAKNLASFLLFMSKLFHVVKLVIMEVKVISRNVFNYLMWTVDQEGVVSIQEKRI